jgi:putative ABC transport system permease protein
MDTLVRDLRFALRGLLRTPGFTAAAVLALALGIGATTAIFSVVHAVLMRSLGWGEESRLISIQGNFDNMGLAGTPVSAAEARDLRKASFLEQAGASVDGTAALQGERAERVRISLADAGFFHALGVQPIYGRVFTEAEESRGNDGVALLSWSAFRKRYAGDASVVGRSVTLNGVPRTVIGVLPESFRWHFPNEFWVPFGFTEDEVLRQRGNRYLRAVARLAPGVTPEVARVRLVEFSRQMVEQNPASYGKSGWRLSLEPLRDRFVGSARPPLLLILGAVLIVLLIACANVANLLLARGAARSREIAVRSALGAGRSRIVRQLLTESGLLALAGAALGVLVAAWSVDALVAAAPAAMRQLADVRVSRAVLAFAAASTVATTLASGLIPALQVSRANLAEAMHEAAYATAGRHAGRLRSGLVVAQFSLSLVLLIGAALLLRSFATLLEVPAGFDAKGVLAARAGVGGPQYEDAGPQARYWEEAMRRVSALPGVTAAGAMNLAPLEGPSDWSYDIEGYLPRPSEPGPDDQFRRVTGGFFRALRIPVLHGREFTAADDAKAPPVALVNEAWVRRWFPGQDVVGKRLRVAGRERPWRVIVGVVGDAHDLGLDRPTPPVYYVPESQQPDDTLTVMVRTQGDPAALVGAVREALSSIDPAQPVDWVEPLESRIGKALVPRRFPLQLLATFAALALVLSALGIYGVTAYSVTQRSREIGVRIAIGAQRRDVLRMVMGGAVRLAALGVCIGLLAALAGARLLASQLYGVSARDPLTYAAISLLLALVALAASFLPALRATRVDPMSALRAE